MRHKGMGTIVNSIKHYVQAENAAIASGAIRSIDVVDAVGQAAVAATEDVVEGSLVKAIFLEYWLHSEASNGNVSKFQYVLEKVPAG